jgi:hypothetical protein
VRPAPAQRPRSGCSAARVPGRARRAAVRAVLRRGGALALKAFLLLGLAVFVGSCAHVLAQPLLIGAVGEHAYNELLDRLHPPRAAGVVVAQATASGVVRLTGRVTRVEDGAAGGPPRLVAVRASDGREVLLRVDSSVGIAADRLRQHMARGVPVTVSYRQLGGVHVAVAIAVAIAD